MKKKIIAYFEGSWNKQLNTINGCRLIMFDKTKGNIVAKAIFQYLDYLFIARGCNSYSWIVAEKNEHAKKIYDKFIKKYFGHIIGYRHYGQKAYDGEISNVFLYEITKEEFFEWKNTFVKG